MEYILCPLDSDHPENHYRSSRKFSHIADAREAASLYDRIYRVSDRDDSGTPTHYKEVR